MTTLSLPPFTVTMVSVHVTLLYGAGNRGSERSQAKDTQTTNLGLVLCHSSIITNGTGHLSVSEDALPGPTIPVLSPCPAHFLGGKDAAAWARSHLTFQLSQRLQPHPPAQLWPRAPTCPQAPLGAGPVQCWLRTPERMQRRGRPPAHPPTPAPQTLASYVTSLKILESVLWASALNPL